MSLLTKYYTANRLGIYNTLFHSAQILPKWKTTLDAHVKTILQNKERYVAIEKISGVPWYFIACLHMRESTLNFNAHLHNGDSLSRRTINVPSGLPKFSPKNGVKYTFEESAYDALVNTKKYNTWSDWSISGMLYIAEMYNGAGYAKNGRSNPYLWSGTQHYTSGKYVKDGVYNNKVIDKQLGVVVLLKYLLQNETLTKKKVSFLDKVKFFIGR
jgi:lysozyme family protein